MYFLCPFDPIRCYCLRLRGYVIILTGHTRFGSTPLDEWKFRRTDFYLTIHKSQEREIHVPGGIRTSSPKSKRSRTHVLDRPTTGNGYVCVYTDKKQIRNFRVKVYIYRVIKRYLCTWWLQYKQHKNILNIYNNHDNVVRIRDNRRR
jgi:hypothetical protein